MNYFIENDILFVICVEENNSNQLRVLKYELSQNNLWALKQDYSISIPGYIRDIQDTHLLVLKNHIILCPYSADGTKRYIFLIEKGTFNISFSGYFKTKLIGEIYNIVITNTINWYTI